MNDVEKIRSSTKEYYVYEDNFIPGLWHAEYRPLNKKTGKPWQASRRVLPGTHDCHQCSEWRARRTGPLIVGVPPSFDEVCKQGWSSLQTGFSSRDKAIEAVNQHCSETTI